MELLFSIGDYKKRSEHRKANTKKLSKIIKVIEKELIKAYDMGWNVRYFTFTECVYKNKKDMFNMMYRQGVLLHFLKFGDISVKELIYGNDKQLAFSFNEVK